jgi:hypothetical protein
MKDVMRLVMQGEATDAQIGAFLMGLRLKSETIDEITGATEVMRELATGVTVKADNMVDIVGTGATEPTCSTSPPPPPLWWRPPAVPSPNTATAACPPKAAAPT